MKTVIITADGHEHRFVTKYLVDALGDHLSGIIIEQKSQKNISFSSFGKAAKRYNLLTIIERVVTKIVRKLLRAEHRQHAALNKVLGHVFPKSYLPDNIPILEAESANREEAIEWLANIKPDYIFVYGTGIIGKRVLSTPLLQALNLHTGISPYYRGSSCAFWPLYNKEPLMVGSTVHKCTPELDGGDIYDRVSVRLSKNDDPYTAFAKSVKAGAILYSSIAKRLVNEAMVPSEKQDFSLGKEYRFKNKTVFHELKMEYMILSGKLNTIITSTQNIPLPFLPKNRELSDAK